MDSDFLLIQKMKMGDEQAIEVFVVMIMPELWKNRNVQAMEVECTTYFHLRQVYAARMIIFALVDLFMLSMFCIAVSFTARFGVWEFVIHFFIPFNISCCICFGTLYSKRYSSEVLAVLLCMLWSAIWVEFVLNSKIYKSISMPIWLVMFVVSILYICGCITRGQRNFEKIWEADASLWN